LAKIPKKRSYFGPEDILPGPPLLTLKMVVKKSTIPQGIGQFQGVGKIHQYPPNITSLPHPFKKMLNLLIP